MDGVSCGGPGDCCNQQCNAGVCGAPGCLANGLSCFFDNACCAGKCAVGKCGCVADGQACFFGKDCCSGQCAVGKCGCVVAGLTCVFDVDCCAGSSCKQGKCKP